MSSVERTASLSSASLSIPPVVLRAILSDYPVSVTQEDVVRLPHPGNTSSTQILTISSRKEKLPSGPSGQTDSLHLHYVGQKPSGSEPRYCDSDSETAISERSESVQILRKWNEFVPDEDPFQPEKSASFVPLNHQISRDQYKFLSDLVRPLTNDKELRKGFVYLMSHVMISKSLHQDEQDHDFRPGVFVHRDAFDHCKYLTHRVRKSRRLLEDAGLLNVSDDFSAGRFPKRYSVPQWIEEDFFEIGIAEPQPRVHAYSGRLSRKKARQRFTDEEKNGYPALVSQALKVLSEQPTRINLTAGREYQRLRREKLTNERSLRRFFHDQLCLSNILAVAPENHGSVDVPLTYDVSSTGRVFVQGGLSQSCTAEFKSVIFSDIRNLHNYDLSASQSRLQKMEFDEYGISCTWLDDYLEGGKDTYLTRINESLPDDISMSKKCLKSAAFGLQFGASIPDPNKAKLLFQAKANGYKVPDLISIFYEYHTTADSQIVYESFYADVQDFVDARDQWYDYLRTEYIPENRTQKGYVYNACGMPFRLADFKGAKRLRTLAAHILQGYESAFIHHLTILSTEYGFNVLQNEHDGLVTLGRIPPEAIQSAASKSATESYVRLIEKPFY